jgi:hypothetical protein
MKKPCRFSEQRSEIVERQGRLVNTYTAVFSPDYRSRYIPRPPPPPLPRVQQQLVRDMAEGKIIRQSVWFPLPRF